MTASGHTCQRWSEQSPHAHNRTPENFPCKYVPVTPFPLGLWGPIGSAFISVTRRLKYSGVKTGSEIQQLSFSYEHLSHSVVPRTSSLGNTRNLREMQILVNQKLWEWGPAMRLCFTCPYKVKKYISTTIHPKEASVACFCGIWWNPALFKGPVGT